MIIRRCHNRPLTFAAIAVVCFAGVSAAVWMAPRVSAAAAAWLRSPAVRATTVAAGRLPVASVRSGAQGRTQLQSGGTTSADAGEGRAAGEVLADEAPPQGVADTAVTLDPGMASTMVGVTCRARSTGTHITMWLRSSEDGVSWGPWYCSELERGGEGEGLATRSFTEPVWTGGGRYVQVAAVARGAATMPLRDVKVVAIDTDRDTTTVGAVIAAVRRVAATIAHLELTPPAAGMTTAPAIVKRAEWGANESLRSEIPRTRRWRWRSSTNTASGNSYTRRQAAGIVRGIYYYHTQSLGWSDIGYNFLIDRYGTIYEGRYGGVTRGPVGAQVLGFNTGSAGVSVMGNFSRRLRHPPL
jgi:hypothetical protein